MDYFYYSYTPFFKCIDNVIKEVNIAFSMLTGYSRNEFIGKSLDEISLMLKINDQVDLAYIENDFCGFLFTKKCEPREVSITINSYKNKNEKDYFIEEKLNSKIEEVSPYAASLLSDNVCAAAIFKYSDFMILKANKEYMDFLNIPYSNYNNCIGRSLNSINKGFRGEDLNNIFLKVRKTGKSYYANEFKLVYIDKKPKYYFLSTVPIYINGSPKYIISQAYEITESVENRKIVEDQKGELQAIIENMSDALAVMDKDNNICMLNNSAKELLNNSECSEEISEELSYTIDDSEFNLYNLGNFMKNNLLDNESVNKVILTDKRHDETFYYSASKGIINNKYGITEKAIFCFHNITDRIKNQENFLVKTQYELTNKIIENLELGLQIFSYPEYNIIDFNNKAYNELKDHYPNIGPLSEIKGQNLYYAVNVENKTDEILQNINDSNPYIEQINFKVNGEDKYLKLIYQPLYGINNHITEIIVISVDVTEYIKEKNKMEEALKLQDELFVNVSHELKTPLNVIYSAIQLIELYLKSSGYHINEYKINKSISSIKQNCYRFTKLINNILDASKIESGYFKMKFMNVNIVDIIENIVLSVTEYVQSKDLKIIFDTDEEDVVIACDPEKVERIILNLISNAIKFTNAGGTIFVSIHKHKNFIEISVKDTGIGISSENIINIFKRFHQVDKSLSRNAEGSGIGLSLVKSIVELHGGKITAKSKVGKGSTFIINLPNKLVEESEDGCNHICNDNKVEMINIEFSDIYDKGWN